MSGQLATKPETGGKAVEGFCTPMEDKGPQRMSIPPKRVIPIVFLPGIMGSNLRMSRDRQAELKKKNNLAWRPDAVFESSKLLMATPGHRQLQLDPSATEVDGYDPVHNPTGNLGETSAERMNLGFSRVRLNVGPDTPLLIDDPITSTDRKTKEQKAMERGWGEVYFDSYREILETCEERLNKIIFSGKEIEGWWWWNMMNVEPTEWQACREFKLRAISKEQLRKAGVGCWFPVHAMGYNWLRSNRESGIVVAERIEKLIRDYKSKGYQCQKVIIVTHSMGGLVARAVVHPKMGNLEEKVLGVVHGVMPAMGAAAAYKRMRCGFEEGRLGIAPAPKVLGNFGSEVTAVLGNAPGGLELLPSKEYGNGWLQLRLNGKVVKALPVYGDPYEEIYKLQGKWYGLLITDWINPARAKGSGIKQTSSYLDRARKFHEDIKSTYHGLSFAHYGSDPERPSWQNVIWNISCGGSQVEVENFRIVADNLKGRLTLRSDPEHHDRVAEVALGPSEGPGDETVPLHSADHQFSSKKFTGIFRQSGYEHQNSYQDKAAIRSTLFSLFRIIETMKWDEK